MFSVKFDKQHNLLIIVFRDSFDGQQGELLYRRLEQELAKAKKGFMVLSDLSGLETFDSSSYQQIQKIMTLCNSRGVSKIFRVIPNDMKDIGFNIMSIFHYSKNVRIHTYKTLEEANYYIRINTNIPLGEKLPTILNIIKIKAEALGEYAVFRFLVITLWFIILIALRQAFKAFGISLGYLYITLIALTGFWFGMRGGLIAAFIASAIFVIEVNVFKLWFLRDIVLHTMLLRFAIYFLSGTVIGRLSQSEKKIRKKLEFLAGHDELTEFLNFKSILIFLKKEFERSKRHKRDLSIAIIDIDNFKSINDQYGHLVGNDTLKTFSSIMRNNLRGSDIIGRYGGDEFLLIFPESNSEQAGKVLNRISTAVTTTRVTSPFLMNKKAFFMTFSAGLASFSPDTATMNDLIDNADKALYEAKRRGKNRVLACGDNDNAGDAF